MTDPLHTLTHARLRAGQGDVRGARRVLRGILQRDPEDREAGRLLEELELRVDEAGLEDAEPAPPPPRVGDPERLATEFRNALGLPGAPPRRGRIERLERWLEKLTRGRVEGG